MNRFIAPTGNALAAAVLTLLGALPAIPALADAPITAQYQGQSIRFSHLSSSTGALAIGVNDPGFAALLRSTGAVLTWKPGERYILLTTSEPTVVSFAIGDRRYDVGPIALQASIAPYERGNEAFLPFSEVLRSLDLALRQDAAGKVLQPQLATLDVRQVNDLVVLNVHGGAPLRPRIVRQTGSEVVYAFDGVGTTLTGARQINTGGVRSVQVQSSGTVRVPTALVTVELQTGATVRPAQSTADRDVVLSFGGSAAAPQTVAEESPTPQPVPPSENAPSGAPAANGTALVTSVTAQPSAGGTTVAVAVTGNAQYEWHRLRDPDNRFWIDVKAAQLQGPPIEAGQQSPLVSMRVRQLDAATVRIALSLDGPKTISITPSATGLLIEIGNEEVADAARSGSGSLGSVISSSPQSTAPVTPAPLDNVSSQTETSDTAPWKFGPRSSYVATNPRLIVIDPGHGGSDPGSQHGGLKEADLTLDMAKRLSDILISRGWQVKMTRQTDVDVYAPGDSAHDELQARVDVANNAGARLFVSIHANAFINSGPYGTTCYISKPDDVALGRIVETHLAADGTKDDGLIKAHYYVTYHTRMPAVLIETAFLTNPGDYALLASAAWRQKVAQAIADGIAQYAQEYPAPNQPAQ
ncbi:MAG: N-acetylmuramoyl-L-alanine amidase [Candidatus Cybelea sp.]